MLKRLINISLISVIFVFIIIFVIISILSNMTTLTIQIPDSQTDVIKKISNLIKDIGGHMDIESDDLSKKEFELLQESYKELMVKDGLKKATPASELWND